MNKILSYLIALCVIVCGIGGLAPTASAQGKKQPTKEDIEDLIKTQKNKQLTLDEYKAVFLNFAKFEVDPDKLRFDWDNPVEEVVGHLKWDYKLPEGVDAFLAELYTNESPQLRGSAIKYTDDFSWTRNGVLQKLLDALQDEKDLFVINRALDKFMRHLDNDGVAKFVLSQVDNENTTIRKSVIDVLTFSESYKNVEGVIDAVRKMMNDKDPEVRSLTYSLVHKLNDVSFIDDLEKVLEEPDVESSHSSALKSLYGFWYDYPAHKRTNKRAYDICVKYLTKKPRTDELPDLFAVNVLASRDESNIEEWKKNATYYSDLQWLKYMTDIATDVNANSSTRGAAIETMAKVGTKDDLNKLKATLTAHPDTDKAKAVLIERIEGELPYMDK